MKMTDITTTLIKKGVSVKISQNQNFFLFPTFIPLSGVGTTYFHYVVIKVWQLFLRQTKETDIPPAKRA
jgi:hypothetical protein